MKSAVQVNGKNLLRKIKIQTQFISKVIGVSFRKCALEYLILTRYLTLVSSLYLSLDCFEPRDGITNNY
jgi:hypothetical protein